MKFNKGMWLDGKPSQNPSGTTRISKNLIRSRSLGADINELGHIKIDAYGNEKKVIGVILLDKNDFIVFYQHNIYGSVIEYVDSNQISTVLSTDTRYNFSISNPIHGEFNKTPEGDTIIIWTDGVTTRYANINKPIQFQSTLLFYNGRKPGISSIKLEQGGQLPAGAYYPIFRYIREDGSTTDIFKEYKPIVVTNADITRVNDKKPNEITNKQINLLVSVVNLDGIWSKLQVGFITKINNVNTSFIFKEVNLLSGTNAYTVIISGNENKTAVALEEILIDSPKYKSAKQITQLQDTLYLADLTEYKEPSHQNKLNNLDFVFTSENLSSPLKNYKDTLYSRDTKTFAHGEVYAIYIRFKYSWGSGRWYHTAGRVSKPGEKDGIPSTNYLKYQLEDTCSWNGSEGELSFWENRNEPYPNTGEFPAGNVRHFKFPSIRWMKENVYNYDPYYGSRWIDVLGLQLKTQLNLDSFKDCENESPYSYELGFARRDVNTGLNLGQSLVTFPSLRIDSNNYGETSFGLNAHFDLAYTHSLIKNKARVYPVEWLYNKKAPQPTHIRLEAQLTSNLYVVVSPLNFGYRRLSAITHYAGNVATVPSPATIGVNKSTYIIGNTVLGSTTNTFLEDTILLELTQTINLTTEDLSDFGTLSGTVGINIPNVLVTLLNIQDNVYPDFKSQQIVPGESPNLNVIYGDAYINKNASIINYGLGSFVKDYTTDITENDKHNPIQGNRIMHVYTYESMYNMNLRYLNPDTLGGYTDFYTTLNERSLESMRLDREPNAIIQGYSTDYNAQNDIYFSDIYDTYSKYTGKEPFIAIKGQRNLLDNTTFGSWIKFLPNDRKELPKTRGRLVHIDAGQDFLIFHFERGLYITRPVGQLESGGETIFVGSGQIFDRDLYEIIHDKLGALGTQHKFSCRMTKFGYFWIDAEQKKGFKFSEGVKEITINGLRDFFLKYSECIDDNPFNSFGYHTTVDEENRRLLITKKHKILKPEHLNKFKGVWKPDQNFLNSLQSGDIVLKEGRYLIIS